MSNINSKSTGVPLEQALPGKARVFITGTIVMGLVALSLGFQHPETPHRPQYLCYLVLSVLASALKVRLPGVNGTLSPNFLFILIGIADLSLPETLAMACAATCIQCYWNSQRRPMPVQVAFNVAALVISAAAAYQLPHILLGLAQANSVVVLLALAAIIFYLTNTLLVSTVLAFIGNQPIGTVWLKCHLWSFPYYVAGAAVAALMHVSNQAAGWPVSLLILPVMYLVYAYYHEYTENAAAH